jgi:hypothetical protein
MQSVRDGLIHDATSLFRFVDSIDRFIAEHETQFTYNDATESFFRYLRIKTDETKSVVFQVLENEAQSSLDDGLRYRRELTIQKDRWKIRHTYIKPAADAHTLNIPAPLIKMAESDLREISQTGHAEVVVLLTPELMYFAERPNDPLLKGTVFLEIPYSQASGFFGNLTIYHELGHFMWDKLLEEKPTRPAFAALIDGLEKVFDSKLSMRVQDPVNRNWIRRSYDAWTQELFCDLFAIRHVGPAASFALIDILSLFGLMQDENEVTFKEKHPAPALRLREQLQRLQADGWWQCMDDLRSEHVNLTNRLAAVDPTEYKFAHADAELPWQIVESFLEVVPLIQLLAIDVTSDVQARSADFREWRSSLEDCLVNGIVPSKLLEIGAASPTPVSMINAAYCVYLARLPELMSKLEGQDVAKPDHRQTWIERLEDWTMKGIDDYYLLAGCKGI